MNGFPGYEKVDSKTAESDTVEFTGLAFGYYYVTSTLGAVVSINTVNPSATIVDKNPLTPDLDNDPDPEDPDKDVVNSNGDSIDGTVVSVGDTLTYVISWTNTGYYTEDEDGTLASVVVKDAAPEGTELVGAKSSTATPVGNPTFTVTDAEEAKVTFTNGEATVTVTVTDDEGNEKEVTTTITAGYEVDEENGAITWTFTGLPKDYSIEVTFDVTVLESAKDNDQNRIDNTANVIVNNTFDLETNQVTNYVPDPSDPSKDVKLVKNGTVGTNSYNTEQTQVGEILQYEITYQNYEEDGVTGKAQKVVIEDSAPTGTVYVKDSAAVIIKDADGKEVTVDNGTFTYTDGDESPEAAVTIEVNADGIITWTVEKLPVNYTVVATFQVEVTEAAYSITDYTIRNTADVSINNDPKIETNEVENPVEPDNPPPDDGNPGKVIVQADGTKTQVSTGSFGETVTFDLGIDAVNYVDSGEDTDGDGVNETVLVKEYYIYDKMDPGFTLDELTNLTIGTVTCIVSEDTTYTNNLNSTMKKWVATYTNSSGTTVTAATFYTCEVKDDDGNVEYTLIMGTVIWATSTTDSEGNTTYSALYPNCEIHLTYTATINEKAEIAGTGNVNAFKFSYQTIDGSGSGDEPDPENPAYPDNEDLENGSEERSTTTYTYALAIQKISSETGEPLAGATFTVTDNNGQTVYGVAVDSDNDDEIDYYNYTSDSTKTDATNQFVTNSDGQIIIKGVDVGTYTFTETKAPDGYILLTESQDVTATMSSSTTEVTTTVTTTSRSFAAITEDEWASYTGTAYVKTTDEENNTVLELAELPEEYDSDITYYKLVSSSTETTESGNIVTTNTFSVAATVLAVLNTPGAELPFTGGAGTTVFYILGAILAVGAGILLVVRRRMSVEK